MKFLRVVLEAPDSALSELESFYAGTLGVEGRVGETELEFSGACGEPFYHFALLVPGDRFQAALAWARERVELLPGGDGDDVVFDFADWDALACYFHDPAANIVELIAHRGIGEQGRAGAFSAGELLGFSELGLVGDPPELARDLAALGLELWDGTLNESGRLAFLGERGRTLILSPAGRGWMPTGRPAEPHAVEAVLSGVREGAVFAGVHRLRSDHGS